MTSNDDTTKIARLYSAYLSNRDVEAFEAGVAEVKKSMEDDMGGAADRAWRVASSEAYEMVRSARVAELLKALEPPGVFLPPTAPPPRTGEAAEVSAPALMALVVEHAPTLASMVPSLKPVLDKMGEGEGGCSGCARNRALGEIRSLLAREVERRGLDASKVLSATSMDLGPLFGPGRASPGPLGALSNVRRDSCQNCVVKHLSQAMVVCEEVLQGYPDHVKYAVEHLSKAINKADMGAVDKLVPAMVELEGAARTSMDADRCAPYLRAALVIMESAAGPASRWRLIGHLGEAADECVLSSPMLAEMIRSERLRVMDDPEYKPDLEALLNVASSLPPRTG